MNECMNRFDKWMKKRTGKLMIGLMDQWMVK